MAKTPKKTRNPNDSTFRNINALKKRVAELEQRIASLDHYLAAVTADVSDLRRRDPRV